jgi:hypothetical protein
VNALLHRLDMLEKEAKESNERCEVLQISKSSLEADNERLSSLCDNKDVSGNCTSSVDFKVVLY